MREPIEALLQHAFNNQALLTQALTHTSCSRNRQDLHYERLEFLGDRVLGLVIAEILLAAFPDENEGMIAKRHAALVRKETLATVAETLNLADYIRIPAGDRVQLSASVLADVCEALIAALYLDGGLSVAADFINRHWQPLMHAALTPPQDAKSALQEWAQGRGLPRPVYMVTDNRGSDHLPVFVVEVHVNTLPILTGEGSSKKIAEQAAAAEALACLQDNNAS